MLPGSVKNIANYGVFIQFPGGLSGLVPKQVCSKPIGDNVGLKLVFITFIYCFGRGDRF